MITIQEQKTGNKVLSPLYFMAFPNFMKKGCKHNLFCNSNPAGPHNNLLLKKAKLLH